MNTDMLLISILMFAVFVTSITHPKKRDPSSVAPSGFFFFHKTFFS